MQDQNPRALCPPHPAHLHLQHHIHRRRSTEYHEDVRDRYGTKPKRRKEFNITPFEHQSTQQKRPPLHIIHICIPHWLGLSSTRTFFLFFLDEDGDKSVFVHFSDLSLHSTSLFRQINLPIFKTQELVRCNTYRRRLKVCGDLCCEVREKKKQG